MPIYICPRCRYNTKIRTHMTNHFNRKKECKVVYNDMSIEDCIKKLESTKKKKEVKINKQKLKILPNPIITNNSTPPSSSKIFNKKRNEFICPNCNKDFTRSDNLKRHQKICESTAKTHENEFKNIFTKNEVEILLESMNSDHVKRDQINQIIIKELRHQINLLMQNQGSNITYNTNIMLNAFGQENTNYIDTEFIEKLIKSGPLNSIPLLLQHIHFNKEHNENHNIMIPNKKSTFAKIFNGINWQISDKKKTIDDMTDKAYAMINEHYSGNNSYMNDFKDKYDAENPQVNKKVQRDTEIMILNNQSNPINSNQIK